MDAEVIARNYGCECRYTPTVMDGPVFRWSHHGWEMASASRNGVMCHTRDACRGESFDALIALLVFARQVADRLAALGWFDPVDPVKEFVASHKG